MNSKEDDRIGIDETAEKEAANAGSVDTVEIKTKSEIEAVKAEAEQWRDRFLRKAAEMENFRKRSERDRMESSMFQKSSILLEFLPIVDACERALKSFGDDDDKSGKLYKYRQGVELLYKQLGDVLSRMGVVPMEAKGHPFDPNMHEALSNIETMDQDENTVVEELRRGYLIGGKLLRPAQVVIACRPSGK
jgi:molecular chaperone GrpE